MAASSAYFLVGRPPFPSIPQFTPPSSSFTSHQLLKTSHAFSFQLPKNRSRLPVISIRQEFKEATSQSWNTLVLKSETPVLVEFCTKWCDPCQMVHQVIDEIATDYDGKLKRVVVNVDQEPRVADEYNIKAVPIVLLFKNGEKQESVIGSMPKEFFVSAIERVLAT